MMIKIVAFIVCIFCSGVSMGQTNNLYTKKKLLFSDDFSSSYLNPSWVVESSENSKETIEIINDRLQLNTKGGITVWYKNKLCGNLLIEFDRTVVMKGGENDRLSDMNQFWMATDSTTRMFTRKGAFREYDSLRMYYVGIGGNYNKTTRMRRYDGNGNLQILKEYNDSAHLLTPNKTYHIEILFKDGESRFSVDGVEFFRFKDPDPLKEGWFALRSTKCRQLIDNVQIWQLD